MTTYRDSGDYTWQDGNGPQPEPAAAEDNGATVRLGFDRTGGYAYTIRGENITAKWCGRAKPAAHYDLRTIPERFDDDLDAIRRDLDAARVDVEALRACMAEMVDALEELGLRLPDQARAVRWDQAPAAQP